MKSSPPPCHLSVIVPAYNEERCLGRSLERIIDYLSARHIRFEVLVVDDGSTDGTAAIAHGFERAGVKVLHLIRNAGKGAALRHGVLASRGESVLLCDADLSTPIEEVEVLWPHLVDADLVLGSRAAQGAEIARRQPWHRRLLGWIFRKAVFLTSLPGIQDSQCGFKLLRGALARRLSTALVTRGFAFDVELLWLARRWGLRLQEVGVRWEDSPQFTVRPLLDPWRKLLEMARFRWHHRGLRPLAPDESQHANFLLDL